MMGDLRVALRTGPSGVASLKRVTHAPADSTLHSAILRGQLYILWAPGIDRVGSIRHRSQNFLRRWVGRRLVLKVFSQDGFSSVLWSRSSTRTGGSRGRGRPCDLQRQVPAVLFFRVEVPQLPFIDRVADASFPWRFHRCSSWRRWLTCPLCDVRCLSRQCRKLWRFCTSTRWTMSLMCRSSFGSRNSGGGSDSVHRRSRGPPVLNRDGSFQQGYGGGDGFFGGFSAFSRSSGRPGVERQLSEPSMTKSSSSSRAPLHNKSPGFVDIHSPREAPHKNNHNNHNNNQAQTGW